MISVGNCVCVLFFNVGIVESVSKLSVFFPGNGVRSEIGVQIMFDEVFRDSCNFGDFKTGKFFCIVIFLCTHHQLKDMTLMTHC